MPDAQSPPDELPVVTSIATPDLSARGRTADVRHWLPLPLAIWFWGHLRRVLVLVVGCTIILAGLVMLVTPGPGGVTIWGGLLLLATEFAWARWALKVAQQRLQRLLEAAQKSMTRPPSQDFSGGSDKSERPPAVSASTGNSLSE